MMKRYKLNGHDRKPIETALEVPEENYDEGTYNHTVGCASCAGTAGSSGA